MTCELIYYTEHEGGEWKSFPLDSFRTLALIDPGHTQKFAAIALKRRAILYVFDLILWRMGRNPMREAPAP